jgi:NTP pyrophosphatase (non-canonical NTP hydrolase)
MDLSEYRAFVRDLMGEGGPRPATLYDLAFGLGEEAGEVLGKFKRLERGDYHTIPNALGSYPLVDTARFKADLKKELGDVLWYLTALADRHHMSLQEILDANVEKLEARRSAGTLKGTGDAR